MQRAARTILALKSLVLLEKETQALIRNKISGMGVYALENADIKS